MAKFTNLVKFDLLISLQKVESVTPVTRSVVEFVHRVKMPVRVHLTSRWNNLWTEIEIVVMDNLFVVLMKNIFFLWLISVFFLHIYKTMTYIEILQHIVIIHECSILFICFNKISILFKLCFVSLESSNIFVKIEILERLLYLEGNALKQVSKRLK